MCVDSKANLLKIDFMYLPLFCWKLIFFYVNDLLWMMKDLYIMYTFKDVISLEKLNQYRLCISGSRPHQTYR